MPSLTLVSNCCNCTFVVKGNQTSKSYILKWLSRCIVLGQSIHLTWHSLGGFLPSHKTYVRVENVTENMGMPKFGSFIETSVTLSMDIYTGINFKILASIFHVSSRFSLRNLEKNRLGWEWWCIPLIQHWRSRIKPGLQREFQDSKSYKEKPCLKRKKKKKKNPGNILLFWYTYILYTLKWCRSVYYNFLDCCFCLFVF